MVIVHQSTTQQIKALSPSYHEKRFLDEGSALVLRILRFEKFDERKMFHFRRKVDNRASIHLYRKCMKVVQQLIPSHQKIWYDYTRLKFEENANVSDPKKLAKLIEAGNEELTWMESVLERKKKNKS